MVSRKARLSRPIPLHPRRAADDVPQPLLDDAPVRGLWHRGRGQRALQIPARPGPDRPQHRLRPGDPDRLRQRRSAGVGRGRPGRRGDRLAGRHGSAARRHPTGQGQHQHDHQRAGQRAAGDGDRRGREARRACGQADRHNPKRYSQGIRSARHLHLPARPQRAPGCRYDRLLRPRGAHGGTPSASAATTSATRAARPPRRWASRWPMPSPTWMPSWSVGSASTTSPRASPGSSTPRTTSSRKWPSTAPCAGCGPRSCASSTAPKSRPA